MFCKLHIRTFLGDRATATVIALVVLGPFLTLTSRRKRGLSLLNHILDHGDPELLPSTAILVIWKLNVLIQGDVLEIIIVGIGFLSQSHILLLMLNFFIL